MKRSRKILIGFILFVVVIVLFFLKSFYDAGAFRTVKSRKLCDCRKVPVLSGPEDIVIDAEKRIAYVSAGNWRKLMAREPARGAIYSYDLDKKGEPVDLSADISFPFNPHGISLYRGADGKRFLYAVNHGLTMKGDSVTVKNTIELFEIGNGKLVHEETFHDASMISPNDVTAVGPRSFYFTNDHGAAGGIGKIIEDYFRLKWANIVYFDGKNYSIAAGQICYANGIFLAPGGINLYAISTTGRRFMSYRRADNGALTLESELPLDSCGDNIDITDDGRIFVGSHPNIIAFLKYQKDPKVLSPSQVLEISRAGDGWKKTEAYLDDGSEISGSSVGAVWKDRLLVGSVFAEYFLDCTMNPQKGN